MPQSSIKVKYPLGIKLAAIISILILAALGIITVLVSVMVSNDVRVTAEDNNFIVNKRSAAEAESLLGTIRSGALVLLDTLNVVGSSSPAARQSSSSFFERNPDFGFIGLARTGQGPAVLTIRLLNERFFLSNELKVSVLDEFFGTLGPELDRAGNGETLLVNAAPALGIPALVLIFPWEEEGEHDAAAVLFASGTLMDNFGTGVNSSFMINDAGDVLIHADYERVHSGVNDAASPFVAMALASPDQNRQTLYQDEDGKRYFGAFQKISLANAVVITTVPWDVVFEGVAATTWRNIFLTGAVLFAAVLFIWFFSKTISNPLKELAGAAGQIEQGNFNLDLKPRTRDEVGFLTTSFQKMSGALGIFGRFTNKEIALRAMRGEIKPGGLKKNATIFFSDIRSFTAKSEKFTEVFGEDASNKIVHWLNVYFTRMVECVEKTGGVVDKFIGDAVMAHWGTASTAGSPEADAYNCVRAALLMREALVEMNKDRSADDPANPPIRIGCGINTGIVTAGQIGSDIRMEYTVIGDPVNLASRTEALNKPMGTDILITENTWELVGSKLITEEMPAVTVKGKEQPVRMFAVVGLANPEKGALDLPQNLKELRTLLGIEDPGDLTQVDTGEEEKKYKIGGTAPAGAAKPKSRKTGKKGGA